MKPTVVVKAPPIPGTIQVPQEETQKAIAKADPTLEQQILRMERQIVVAQIERRIQEQAKQGESRELKQLLLVSDEVADELHQATPPEFESQDKIATLGFVTRPSDGDYVSVEGFIGTHITPESERELLKKVEAELNSDEARKKVNVSVAGWWPEAGVLAVRVAPQS